MGDQTLMRLRGLDGAFMGCEIDLLHPFEPVTPVQHDMQPAKAAPLSNWMVYHQAFLLEQALGGDALLSTQPGRLRVEPYQLVPVLRAIRMSRPRLLLADGVGLGKTIQAGLILTELMARRIAHRILVVSPAGPLLEQWKTELLERFGLRATIIDRPKLDEIRKSTELGANPFDHISIGLASVDFLKQESVLDLLERATYDVVVIDEAHHCMDLGISGEREDSLRRRMAEALSRRCDCLLLATATPHDGNDRSFASLCELLDYSLVDGRGSLRGTRYQNHVVRRLKDHIKDPVTGQPRFKRRVVLPVPVTGSGAAYEDYRALQRGLVELVAPEIKKALRSRRYEDVLSFIALLKRSVSSVAACRSTLNVVSNRFAELVSGREEDQDTKRQRLRTLRDYNRKLEQFGALSPEEEAEREILEAEDLAQSLASLQREIRSGDRKLKQATELSAGLKSLLDLAERTLHSDPKFDGVLKEIHHIRAAEPDANVLVFTEYTTTQQALLAFLQKADIGEVFALSGEDDDTKRSQKTDRFRKGSKLVLVSTDAAGEGLNLHQRCHHLIHVELPFNPNRLEQRNGRIDRYGQSLDPTVRYLYLTHSFEERILLRLIAKYERQRSRLTFVPNTLGNITSSEAMTARLLQGFAEEEGWLLKEERGTYFTIEQAAENEGADPATKELLEEIDRSIAGFERAAKTHSWLSDAGLNAEVTKASEADQAMLRGQRESMVELPSFVASAVQADGGKLTGKTTNPVFLLSLPPSWAHGLDETPGYDPESRTIRLTTDMDLTRTKDDLPVGFLGRAHPLVRRALDRVRHLSYGGDASRGLDIRISAVGLDIPKPALLLTFLGKVNSRAGREVERVLAVKVDGQGKPSFHAEAAEWMDWIRKGTPIPVKDLWERHFSTSWVPSIEEAQVLARTEFTPLARAYADALQQDLKKEAADLEKWLAQRAEDITGEEAQAAEQQELFGTEKNAKRPTPAWRTLKDPRERLAGYVADASCPAAKRHEADGVLRLLAKRLDALHARQNLDAPEIIPLGMLMLIPHKQEKGKR
ncbi:MAG TPA: helicase-related protein [Kiritimatiellia bacterium]|nr:helicase-related protein [Kiritimatiellia bacterium]